MNMSEKNKKPTPQARTLKAVLRIFRILLVPLLCLIALYVGLMIGYVYIGGQDASEVMQWNTWKHLYDLVFAQT